jgi:excisionase family DNA binding protein
MTEAPASPARLIAPLWTVQDVAEFLQVPVQTLYSWRARRAGLPARKVGKYLRYRPDDVMRWVDELPDEAA